MKGLRSILLSSLLVAAAMQAQQASPSMNADSNLPLTNEGVTQLASAGVPDRLVIAKIKAAKSVHFDTTPAGLTALSAAGIHEDIIEAMISRQDAGQVDSSPQPTASAVPTSNPDDPLSPHQAGVYFVKDGKMLAIDPGAFQGEKHTGMLKMMATQGFAKMREKAVLRDAHAPTQIADPNPTFYFYFGKEDTAPVMSFSPEPKSPREYQLVKLEVTKEDRLLETMEAGMTGSNANATTKSAVKFSYSKIAASAYKVTLDTPMAPGEYCFFAGGGAMGGVAPMGRVYDFGIVSGH